MVQNPGSINAGPNATVSFLANLFNLHSEQLKELGERIELPLDISSSDTRMAGVMTPNNKPEFWADAPWRMEPDQTILPLTFYIRDAEIDSPGYAPWRLDLIRVEQLLTCGIWNKLKVYLPDDLPGMDSQGNVQSGF